MTEDDRQAIVAFFDRIRANKVETDADADKLIGELMSRYPETRYAVTQMAFFQEHALAEAQNRIRQLEYQMQQRQGGVFGGLFGGRQAPPPAPSYAPGYRPGMFDQRRGGFLGTAATTVMGVAGGMLLGHMLTGMLGGHGAQAAEMSASELPSSPWTNPGAASADAGAAPPPSPWARPPADPTPTDQAGNGFADDPYPDDAGGYDSGGDFGGDAGGDT